MKLNKNILSLYYLSIILLIAACTKTPHPAETSAGQFVIRGFLPLANWHYDTTGRETSKDFISKSIFLDYTNAFLTGFKIPTINQTDDGLFHFEFMVKNTGRQAQKFYYRIYYQAETYKIRETDELDSTKQNAYAWENFYGSWEDTKKSFVVTSEIPADGDFHKVSDSFRIVGNPRDEKRFYNGSVNERWKRNPRVGNYSFMLVVTTGENLDQAVIPEYIRNIGLPFNNVFINPYYYFLHGDGKKLKNTIVQKSPYFLKVIAKPDPGAGVYIPTVLFDKEKNGKYFCKTCGQDSSLIKSAPFAQFIHYIDPGTKMYNIPVIADVLKDNYSKLDYNWNKQFYRKEELIAVTATTTKWPCQTVISDPDEHKLVIKNPGTEFGKWEKQNVGVVTRNGFTYGKWTVKAKLTKLLNKNNVWNGLTNAVWLITQEQSDWNLRRDCNKEGYMSSYYGGFQDKRVKTVSYSEIDFEILKTVPYCPSYVLPPVYNHGISDQGDLGSWNVAFPEEIQAADDKIQVACTNWDMACWEPKDYKIGCSPVTYQGQTFRMHRWDNTYRAVTEKKPEKDDDLFSTPYYFQIDWRPDEIIWRIGPSKDKLRVVGYVNSSVSMIPNNQMLLIITQEFHNTKWWVGSPYSQDNIPFPKNDIVGEIYEITVE